MNQFRKLKALTEEITILNTTLSGAPTSDVSIAELGDAINNSKVDVNLKTSDITLPVSGTVAVSSVSGTTDVSGTVAVSSVSGTVTTSGTVSGTVAVSSVAGTVTTSGTVSGTVAVSSITNPITVGSITAGQITVSSVTDPVDTNTNIVNCATTIEITNTELTNLGACLDNTNHHVEVNLNATNGVQVASGPGINTLGCIRVALAGIDAGIQGSSVSEYKMVYKSSYPTTTPLITDINRFESFSNVTLHSADGGINIYPTGPTAWTYGTRFNFLNGNNTFLVIFPSFVGNTTAATPSLECGIQVYSVTQYISIVNDYSGSTLPVLKYKLQDIDQSAGISMSSWNVDIFNGSGHSGLDLSSNTNYKKYNWSWFILISGQTNYCYIGLVDKGRLQVGHQFSIRNNAVLTSNSSATTQMGFRPYYKNNNVTLTTSVYCGGFEVYTKLGDYLAFQKHPYNFYNSYTFNLSTTLYPFVIFHRSWYASNSYVQPQKLYAKTTGTSDVGDFRIEVWHTVDNEFTISGGTTVATGITTSYIHGMTSISGGKKIATFLPRSDNCIVEDISWITHKYFGFDIGATVGYTNTVYFLAINMSSTVNKTLYFSVSWFE